MAKISLTTLNKTLPRGTWSSITISKSEQWIAPKLWYFLQYFCIIFYINYSGHFLPSPRNNGNKLGEELLFYKDRTLLVRTLWHKIFISKYRVSSSYSDTLVYDVYLTYIQNRYTALISYVSNSGNFEANRYVFRKAERYATFFKKHSVMKSRLVGDIFTYDSDELAFLYAYYRVETHSDLKKSIRSGGGFVETSDGRLTDVPKSVIRRSTYTIPRTGERYLVIDEDIHIYLGPLWQEAVFDVCPGRIIDTPPAYSYVINSENIGKLVFANEEERLLASSTQELFLNTAITNPKLAINMTSDILTPYTSRSDYSAAISGLFYESNIKLERGVRPSRSYFKHCRFKFKSKFYKLNKIHIRLNAAKYRSLYSRYSYKAAPTKQRSYTSSKIYYTVSQLLRRLPINEYYKAHYFTKGRFFFRVNAVFASSAVRVNLLRQYKKLLTLDTYYKAPLLDIRNLSYTPYQSYIKDLRSRFVLGGNLLSKAYVDIMSVYNHEFVYSDVLFKQRDGVTSVTTYLQSLCTASSNAISLIEKNLSLKNVYWEFRYLQQLSKEFNHSILKFSSLAAAGWIFYRDLFYYTTKVDIYFLPKLSYKSSLFLRDIRGSIHGNRIGGVTKFKYAGLDLGCYVLTTLDSALLSSSYVNTIYWSQGCVTYFINNFFNDGLLTRKQRDELASLSSKAVSLSYEPAYVDLPLRGLIYGIGDLRYITYFVSNFISNVDEFWYVLQEFPKYLLTDLCGCDSLFLSVELIPNTVLESQKAACVQYNIYSAFEEFVTSCSSGNQGAVTGVRSTTQKSNTSIELVKQSSYWGAVEGVDIF